MHEPKFYIPEGNSYYTRRPYGWSLDDQMAAAVPSEIQAWADEHDRDGYSDNCVLCRSEFAVPHGAYLTIKDYVLLAARLADKGHLDTAAEVLSLAQNVYHKEATANIVPGENYMLSSAILAEMESAQYHLRYAASGHANQYQIGFFAQKIQGIYNDLAAEFEMDEAVDEGEPCVWGGEIYCRNPKGTGDIPF